MNGFRERERDGVVEKEWRFLVELINNMRRTVGICIFLCFINLPWLGLFYTQYGQILFYAILYLCLDFRVIVSLYLVLTVLVYCSSEPSNGLKLMWVVKS